MSYKNITAFFFLALWMGGGIVCGESCAASNQKLHQLKKANKVREKGDGYLEAIDPTHQSHVAKKNQKRRQMYEGIAKKRGVSVEVIAAEFAAKLSS